MNQQGRLRIFAGTRPSPPSTRARSGAVPAALLGTLLGGLLATPTVAQEGHDHGRPYAGLEGRAIKALPDEERRDLLEGEGMGLALAAELNGYPGPKHVLELADALALDAEQRAAVEAVRSRMLERAIALGRRIVEAEAGLDSLFASGAATAWEVEGRTEAIEGLRGRLRAAHLVAHLETRVLLTETQTRRYAELRGYAGGHAGGEGHTGADAHAGGEAHHHGEPRRP